MGKIQSELEVWQDHLRSLEYEKAELENRIRIGANSLISMVETINQTKEIIKNLEVKDDRLREVPETAEEDS